MPNNNNKHNNCNNIDMNNLKTIIIATVVAISLVTVVVDLPVPAVLVQYEHTITKENY